MKETLRVLQYVRVLDNGGIESLVFSLLDKMNRQLVKFDFLLTRNKREAYEDAIAKYNAKKYVVPVNKNGCIISKYVSTYKLLYEFFRQYPYKIVHFQSVGTSLGGSLALLAAKRAGIPVRIVHGHSAYSKTSLLRRIDIHIGQVLHIKWGTHFMACSEKAAQYSFGQKYKKRVHVDILKNGIDANCFVFNNAVRNEVRKEFNIENSFVIGSIGRLSPPKNHRFMFDILKAILKYRDNAILFIVGSQSTGHEKYAQDLKKVVRENELEKQVIFVGERRDVNRIYNAMDVYLFPSLWEGLGIAAIEAQANGLPVYASTMVPEEARIISNFHYLDLELSADDWAKSIVFNNNARVSELSEIITAGYDIRSSAEYLTDYYLKLAHSI